MFPINPYGTESLTVALSRADGSDTLSATTHMIPWKSPGENFRYFMDSLLTDYVGAFALVPSEMLRFTASLPDGATSGTFRINPETRQVADFAVDMLPPLAH